MSKKVVSVWTSIPFWRRSAAWVTGFAAILLIWLTFDSMGQISMGTDADLKNGITKIKIALWEIHIFKIIINS